MIIRKIACTLTACLLLNVATASLAQERKKVAVVLSGGGAKGTAHISALKVIEKAGIPVDYVVGTSMGALVGGLYSMGYTTDQLDSLVRNMDWKYMLTDATDRKDELLLNKQRADRYVLSAPFKRTPKDAIKGGLIQGRNIGRLLTTLTEPYVDSIDFNKLPIPFACVAHNIVDGSEYDFHSGKLPLAMRASMSIPGAFAPVKYQNMILVDGGMSNNFPVDVAKKMGADLVIGVDVQNEQAKVEDIAGVTDVLTRIIDNMCNNKAEENKAMTDVYIKVDVEGYSASSFTPAAIDTLMRHGDEAAQAQWDNLIALKKKVGLPDDFQTAERKPYETMNADSVNQNIVPELDPGKTPVNTIRAGFRFDNETLATLLFNANFFFNKNQTKEASLTLRLGKSAMGQLAYSYHPSDSKWTLGADYQIDYHDLDLYNNGKKLYNFTYLHNHLNFGVTRSWREVRFDVGVKFEYFDIRDFMMPPGHNEITKYSSEGFINYYGAMQFDNYDRRAYPNKGMKWHIRYGMYTDNCFKYDNESPISIISASWEGVFRLRRRLHIQPFVYGRVVALSDNAYPLPLINVVGGVWPSMYMPQQLPFVGIRGTQMCNKQMYVAGARLRQRIIGSQYLSVLGNFGIQTGDLEGVFTKSNQMWGMGVNYGINTFVGPVEGNLFYSNITKSVGFYFSLGYNF